MSDSTDIDKQLEALGERIRGVGRPQQAPQENKGTMQDLVYDEELGCFVMKERGTTTSDKETVITRMAEDGFAHNAH